MRYRCAFYYNTLELVLPGCLGTPHSCRWNPIEKKKKIEFRARFERTTCRYLQIAICRFYP